MLARANRIVHGGEYRTVVRRGVRSTGPHTVTYVRRSAAATPARFGFIVAKTVGSAVTRNTVRRRLKAVAFELVTQLDVGTDIVIRALPSSAAAPWSALRHEVAAAVLRSRDARLSGTVS
ncbi:MULTISPECIES: ribonuclease P protein component [unclassified Rathayibacter]|uniref:ribonuclease P protein component n=1 Tax=unclassified Rathayibacter TaxID=2609250 RepID=UPI00188CAAB0|nr:MULTISPECIES: ribonuclease P protein component [unclassified Rathayibacter]MBF4461096.1 ribonuclease P protein component [Rathayibacter sp. VKM Ac-2879]MBF4502507.1 ribonuclease P protein component [Rathayibacter sp. VKM Ac-2878]